MAFPLGVSGQGEAACASCFPKPGLPLPAVPENTASLASRVAPQAESAISHVAAAVGSLAAFDGGDVIRRHKGPAGDQRKEEPLRRAAAGDSDSEEITNDILWVNPLCVGVITDPQLGDPPSLTPESGMYDDRPRSAKVGEFVPSAPPLPPGAGRGPLTDPHFVRGLMRGLRGEMTVWGPDDAIHGRTTYR